MISIAALALILTPALAAYGLVDDYTQGNFASQFDFFTDNDPTNGYVNYVDYATAQSEGLYSQSSSQVYIGVDHNKTASGRGRDSVRISSKQSYQHGLIILDLAHMPGGQCGTWPAFWLLSSSATWPNGGEVDIIEGVNSQSSNSMTVHTNAGCSISNTGGMSGQITTPNCDVNAAGQPTNAGCSIATSNTNSYGTGFNANGGGVYATEWTSEGISIYFFPRDAIPSDITSGNPDPSGWGLPLSKFAGACDWDEKVVNQQIVFDVTFCGDWAGNVFSSDSTCSSKASTCQAFVQNNPSAFDDTYWSINALKVYQENGRSVVSSTSAIATATAATIADLSTTSAFATSTAPSTISTVFTTTALTVLSLTTTYPVSSISLTTLTATTIVPPVISVAAITTFAPAPLAAAASATAAPTPGNSGGNWGNWAPGRPGNWGQPGSGRPQRGPPGRR